MTEPDARVIKLLNARLQADIFVNGFRMDEFKRRLFFQIFNIRCYYLSSTRPSSTKFEKIIRKVNNDALTQSKYIRNMWVDGWLGGKAILRTGDRSQKNKWNSRNLNNLKQQEVGFLDH